jgi:hypothetical protein
MGGENKSMDAVTVELGELKSSNLPEIVPYSVVAPAGYGRIWLICNRCWSAGGRSGRFLRWCCDAQSGVDGVAIAGIPMGGYGALKTAFSHPSAFSAVAAMQPLLEPGFEDRDVGARNRIHHVAGGPVRLIGAGCDRMRMMARSFYIGRYVKSGGRVWTPEAA